MTYRDPEPEPAQPPARCPSCGGRELKTTSKAIDRSTYWRCLSCGEIWNLDRRDTNGRSGYRR